MPAFAPYHVVTHNASVNSENKIHDDAVARKYGFTGGLVAGTTVYAHLSTPLVAAFGPEWLGHHVVDLALLKPAYEGQRLTVTQAAVPGEERPAGGDPRAKVRLVIRNAEGVELAWAESAMPDPLPEPDAWGPVVPAPPSPERPPITWDGVTVKQPLKALDWRPTEQDQRQWVESASDTLEIYRGADAPLHPGLIVQAANSVFKGHFMLEPWIHTGSRIVTRGVLRLGRPIQVTAVPFDKWERKGHQFIKLYVAMRDAGRLCVEIYHSAIFKVRIAA